MHGAMRRRASLSAEDTTVGWCDKLVFKRAEDVREFFRRTFPIQIPLCIDAKDTTLSASRIAAELQLKPS